MKLLKTNTNQYKNNFKTHFEAMFKDHTDGYIRNIDDFINHFDTDGNYQNNKRRLPNLQDRLADYLQGMPYGFNYCYNDDFLELTAELHEIKEVPAEKHKIIIKNFYLHCAGMFIKLADKKLIQSLY